MPALLTRTSIRPNSATVASISARTAPSRRRGTTPRAARRPSARTSAATSSHGSSLRLATTTSAPASAKPSAIARPRPLLPPVTTTTLPSQPERRDRHRASSLLPGGSTSSTRSPAAGRPGGRSTRGPAWSTRPAATSRSCLRARSRSFQRANTCVPVDGRHVASRAFGVAVDQRVGGRDAVEVEGVGAAPSRAASCADRDGRSAPTRGRRADRRWTPSPSRRRRAGGAARRARTARCRACSRRGRACGLAGGRSVVEPPGEVVGGRQVAPVVGGELRQPPRRPGVRGSPRRGRGRRARRARQSTACTSTSASMSSSTARCWDSGAATQASGMPARTGTPSMRSIT